MKKMTRVFTLCALALVAATLFSGVAQAQVPMAEREHVQTIVRAVEITTFFTTVAVVLLIWKISSRSQKDRDREREKEENE